MRVLTILLCAVLALTSVHALGVSPPSGTIEFAPNAQGEFDLLISNGRDRSIETSVEIGGPLAEYFSADTPDIGARGSAKATVRYELPPDIKPGENPVTIKWTEEFFDETSGGVAARTAVQARFIVWKPFPGKYAEIGVSPRHVKSGEDTDVKISIASKGVEALSGDVRVRIYQPDGTLQDTLTLTDVQIAGNSDFERYMQIFSDEYEPGKYSVHATYDYNSAVAQAQATLIIGTKSIDIVSLTPVTVYTDQDVTRFDVVVESLWNEPLQVVSAEMRLGSNTGSTPAITLPAFSQKTLTGYWESDTTLGVGSANAKVSASFSGGETIDRIFTVQVYNETPQEPQEEEPAVVLGLSDVVFIIVAFLFIGYFVIHVARRHQ